MAWIGFVAGMLMINGSYIFSSLSDPFGFGWNIFGTADYPWTPYLTGLVPYVQTTAILIGGALATGVVYSVSKKYFPENTFNASIPVVLEISILTMLLLILTIMP